MGRDLCEAVGLVDAAITPVEAPGWGRGWCPAGPWRHLEALKALVAGPGSTGGHGKAAFPFAAPGPFCAFCSKSP